MGHAFPEQPSIRENVRRMYGVCVYVCVPGELEYISGARAISRIRLDIHY